MNYIYSALIVVVFAACCHETFKDEQEKLAHYCAMVEKKAWPDYNHSYETECKDMNK